MGNDLEKALEMLMTMLASKEDEEGQEEELNEISSDEEDEEEAEEKTLDTAGLENMLGTFSGNDKRVTLLSSIKPYMSEKRQGKIDTAINMVRILSISSGLGINLFDR